MWPKRCLPGLRCPGSSGPDNWPPVSRRENAARFPASDRTPSSRWAGTVLLHQRDGIAACARSLRDVPGERGDLRVQVVEQMQHALPALCRRAIQWHRFRLLFSGRVQKRERREKLPDCGPALTGGCSPARASSPVCDDALAVNENLARRAWKSRRLGTDRRAARKLERRRARRTAGEILRPLSRLQDHDAQT